MTKKKYDVLVAGGGEIGAVRVRKIEKKGRQNRRVSIVLE